MHKALKILGVVVLLLAAGAGGGYWWLSRPVALQEFKESVPLETRQRNTDVQTALLVVGIDSALVDIDADRAYIAYEMPANTTRSSDELQLYALGVAATAAPHTAKGIIVQYVDQKATLVWEGELAGARAVQDGTADEAAYLESIVKTPL
jgi:hypothetical protein